MITASKIETMSDLATYLQSLLTTSTAGNTPKLFSSVTYDSTANKITIKTPESVEGAGGTGNDAFCVINPYTSTTAPENASIYTDNSGTPISFRNSKPFYLSGSTNATSMFPLYAYINTHAVIFGTALDSTNSDNRSYFGFCKTQMGKTAIFGFDVGAAGGHGVAYSANKSNLFFSTTYGVTFGSDTAENNTLNIKRTALNSGYKSTFGDDVDFTSFFEPPIFGAKGDRLKNVFAIITCQQKNDVKGYGTIDAYGHNYFTNGFAAIYNG